MVTLSDCRDQVRQRTNNVNNLNFTDSELNSYLNSSLAQLYALTVEAIEDWNVVRLIFDIPTSVGPEDGYLLPADVWKISRIDRALDSSSNAWYSLNRINLRDENLYNPAIKGYYYYPSVMGYNTEVSAEGTYLRIFPQNNKNGTYRLLYYPAFADYTDDDEIKIGPPGQYWVEYAIIDTCIKMCIKDETAIEGFQYQKSLIENRIKSEASTRDIGQTEPPPLTGTWYDRALGYGGFGSR